MEIEKRKVWRIRATALVKGLAPQPLQYFYEGLRPDHVRGFCTTGLIGFIYTSPAVAQDTADFLNKLKTRIKPPHNKTPIRWEIVMDELTY